MSVPGRVNLGFWLAVGGAACCLLAVLVYEKPESFYTNFVILPSLYSLAAGVVLDLVAVVLALTGLGREGRKRALQTLALALLVPPAALAFIAYVLAS
ncbi:MAG TPA: hypothetical protein VKU40_17395 [Thermoanaerobaculia bacterium]|nr:hypothetical protein [Thermoanaerobaculia bacterium]